MEVHSLEEVTHWAKKKHLGSSLDPTEPGVANLIVALGSSPWPCTLSLARVQVASNQKMCSLAKAMDSAKEHFNREKGLEAAPPPVRCRIAGSRWYCHSNRGCCSWC